jgi:hypothetical protein
MQGGRRTRLPPIRRRPSIGRVSRRMPGKSPQHAQAQLQRAEQPPRSRRGRHVTGARCCHQGPRPGVGRCSAPPRWRWPTGTRPKLAWSYLLDHRLPVGLQARVVVGNGLGLLGADLAVGETHGVGQLRRSDRGGIEDANDGESASLAGSTLGCRSSCLGDRRPPLNSTDPYQLTHASSQTHASSHRSVAWPGLSHSCVAWAVRAASPHEGVKVP